MVDIDKAFEAVAKKLDQWNAEGILEEKLKEYGFVFDDSSEPQIQEDNN